MPVPFTTDPIKSCSTNCQIQSPFLICASKSLLSSLTGSGLGMLAVLLRPAAAILRAAAVAPPGACDAGAGAGGGRPPTGGGGGGGGPPLGCGRPPVDGGGGGGGGGTPAGLQGSLSDNYYNNITI